MSTPAPTSLDQARQSFFSVVTLPDNTAQAYGWALDVFASFIGDTLGKRPAQFPLAALQDDVLMQFAAWMQQTPARDKSEADPRPYSPASLSLALAGVRRLLHFLNAQRALPAAFDLERANDALKQVVSQRQVRRVLRTEERLPLILQYFDDLPLPPPDGKPATARTRLIVLRDRAFIHTLFATAGRISEIVSLTRADVQDGRAAEIIIAGKGLHERRLYFSPEAQEAIGAYCKERGKDGFKALFISHGRMRGAAMNRSTGWRIVARGANACGITSQLSPHTFRHWRASQMANEGVPIQVVQAILGHAAITTTRRYVHDDPGVVKGYFHAHTPPVDELLKHARPE